MARRLPAGPHRDRSALALPPAPPDELLRVPFRRFALLWATLLGAAAAIGVLDLGGWLTAPGLAAVSVTIGLIGMLALIRRQEAEASARWPLGERRRAEARWN
jgi:hypothetical protein